MSESCQVEDDDELDAALVCATVLQELLELGPVSGFRTLAFLAESPENYEALTLAVFLARLQLRRQTEILGLLFVLTRM